MGTLITLILIILTPVFCFATSENLDELHARKTRLSTSSWGKDYLEDSSTLVWQPETLAYKDATTGAEVWRLSSTNGVKNSLPDIAWSHWSADGKRFAYGSHRATGANSSSYATNSNSAYQGSVMLMRADGSYLRPADNAPFEVFVHSRFFHWSPTEPDVYYGFGRNYASEGLNNDDLYRVIVGDTSISKSLILDTGIGAEVSIERAIAPDSSKLFALSGGNAYPISLSGGSASLDDSDGWDAHRQLDDYWGSTPSDTSYDFHDTPNIVGIGVDQWFYFIPNGYTAWWRIKLNGSDTDGGPLHTVDNADPYSWGGEVEPVINFGSGGSSCVAENKSPWNCDSDANTGDDRYLSHAAYDRWGKYAAGGIGGGCMCYGVWSLDNHNWDQNSIAAARWNNHFDWDAWSDYFASSPSGVDATDNFIYAIKYDGTDTIKLADSHIRESGSTDYNSNPRVTQSPDGTKLVYHSDFLYSTADTWDIFYAVAYYPYPPEITAVSSGVVTFEWMLDSTPRGYTTRGWPDEATDDPPPPRETEKFRLWKQASCSGDWSPVTTVDAEIFDRYDFADGTWSENDYWTITDPSPSGSDCYAVTAVEWSGLESRVKSNVFSDATDAQTVSYPAAPGADTGITSTYNANLIRYRNLYAEDGSTPTISQTNRIASLPASVTSYVDWLGNTDGSTQYAMTAVDTQGNESTTINVVSAHRGSGQYDLSWPVTSPGRFLSIGSAGKITVWGN